MWNGIIIRSIPELPVIAASALTSGSSAATVQGFLCGAQALGIAWAMRPQTVEEEFDYKRAVGLGIKQWYKVEKMRFGSGSTDTDDLKDHGVVTGYFASAADA